MSKAKILWILLSSTLVIIFSIRHAKDINFDKSSKPFSAVITDKICLRAKGMQSVVTVDFENIKYSITSSADKCDQLEIGDSISLFYDYQKEQFFLPGKKSRASLTFLILAILSLLIPLVVWLKQREKN